jgi:hypothetical protein
VKFLIFSSLILGFLLVSGCIEPTPPQGIEPTEVMIQNLFKVKSGGRSVIAPHVITLREGTSISSSGLAVSAGLESDRVRFCYDYEPEKCYDVQNPCEGYDFSSYGAFKGSTLKELSVSETVKGKIKVWCPIEDECGGKCVIGFKSI